MARILTNKLVTRQMDWHSTFTDKNHLGKALYTKPHVFESVFDRLFSAYEYSDNPLSMKLAARKKTIGINTWEWGLRGADMRPLVITEDVIPSTVTQPGIRNTTFKAKFDENWWVAGDIITPGTQNKKYQCRIQGQPMPHGEGWVYVLKMMTDNPADFIPRMYLEPGRQWGKLYSKYEEASDQSGSTQYSTPVTFRSRMGRYRKKYQVTGDAANTVLAVGITDSDGKRHKSWIKYAEVPYWRQWYRELERGYWYSRSTVKVEGSSGYMVDSGPGIQELLEDSHIHRYNVLTAKLIEEYLMDIFYSRVRPGSGREIVGYTGEFGMLQFHRAVQDWASKNAFIQLVNASSGLALDSIKTPLHRRGISAGHQFIEYRMANGATLRLEHNPLYDDRQINFEIDEVTGYPLESQRITFLDFSGESVGDKSSNICLMDKENSMKLGYVAGMHNPYGPANSELMSHSGDYYEMHVHKECGVHIEDVSKCGELILSRN